MPSTTSPRAPRAPRHPRIRTPYDLAAGGRGRGARMPSADLVKSLRAQADGILSPKLARTLMDLAADEIERLQQLPLI